MTVTHTPPVDIQNRIEAHVNGFNTKARELSLARRIAGQPKSRRHVSCCL